MTKPHVVYWVPRIRALSAATVRKMPHLSSACSARAKVTGPSHQHHLTVAATGVRKVGVVS